MKALTQAVAFNLLVSTIITSCGPDFPGVEEQDLSNQAIHSGTQTDWPQQTLATLTGSGLLKPNLNVEYDNGLVHLAYFDATQEKNQAGIYYAPWNLLSAQPYSQPELVQKVDNSKTLSSALLPSGELALAYQGGATRECLNEEQSDVMLARRQNNWQEQTAAIGWVERNPAFSDGLAGGNIKMAVDRFGRQHIIYQFFYEGCDGNAFAFPDLKLVTIDEGNTGLSEEIFIDGNHYTEINAQVQSLSAGDFSDIIIDENDQALIVYSAIDDNANKRGLKVAQQINQQWQTTWIDDQCQIAGISAARGKEGYIGIAYYTTSCNDESYRPRLKYAYLQDGTWHSSVVPTRHLAGAFPALTLTDHNQPIIASQELASHTGRPLNNLLLSYFSDGQWQFERPIQHSDAGQYNQIFVDDDNRVHIITLLTKLQKIVLVSPP